MSSAVFYRVALPVPLLGYFDYLPAADSATTAPVGARVLVPFGRRQLVGVVAEIADTPQLAADKCKPIIAVLDQQPLLDGELWQSLHWLARYLHAPLGEVIHTALPASLRRGEPLADCHEAAWQLRADTAQHWTQLRQGQPRLLAEYLQQHGATAVAQLSAEQRRAARNLQQRGFIEAVSLPYQPLQLQAQSAHRLNDAQQQAVQAITDTAGFGVHLLQGVTGSGKTEVYLRLIADVLAQGKQALVLVPEIGLTPQMLARFQQQLGVEVFALHSGLNDNQRLRVWTLAHAGLAKVIVGTRSAVFTPLPQAGIVIVDEEHDSSYKQLDGIRYHARDFAIVRAQALHVPIVLGSATPALESLHNAMLGKYQHLQLHQRAGSAKAPQVQLMDIRKQRLEGGLSAQALARIAQTLDDGAQVLVFKNRRGYAPVLLCHDCGWSAHCAACSTAQHHTAMTVHHQGRRLQCHHCGAHAMAPPACPQCGGLALQAQGNGTERIEEVLQQRFAGYPVVRIDRSSTQGRRDALHQQLTQLGQRAGILIGTQMLAKGHDLPNLTLVVVVGVDEGLYSADFRSSEKLAQLLIQVAGRAGRADKPGHVLLQTHHPEHPLLQTLLKGGYRAYADAELQLRQDSGFPPFAHLAMLRAEGRDSTQVRSFLDAIGGLLQHNANTQVQWHGPLPAPMPRRAGFLREQLIISSNARPALHQQLQRLLVQIYAHPLASKLRWSLDVDPVDLH